MNRDLLLWYAARVSGLAAFVVLAAAMLTGMALRTGYLAFLANNRAVAALHGLLTWSWAPLLATHVIAIVLDATARVTPLDVVIPFRVAYAPGSQLAIGLGTLGLVAIAVVTASGALRRRLPTGAWRWLHRAGYPTLVVLILHAQLAGTDVSRTVVSVIGWAIVGALAMLSLPRVMSMRTARRR